MLVPIILTAQCALPARAVERPNIILIVADDLGFSDLGCYGGEIATPNLDALAKYGLHFRQFYDCARCCPSRACLMTGLYPRQAGVGDMNARQNAPGYRGFPQPNTVTIAEVLLAAGCPRPGRPAIRRRPDYGEGAVAAGSRRPAAVPPDLVRTDRGVSDRSAQDDS